ncbi:hypothetical protein [Nocardia sp. X0981]
MQIPADGLSAAPTFADRDGAVVLARTAETARRLLAVVVTRRSGV